MKAGISNMTWAVPFSLVTWRKIHSLVGFEAKIGIAKEFGVKDTEEKSQEASGLLSTAIHNLW